MMSPNGQNLTMLSNEHAESLMSEIDDRYKSGNSIPVERAFIRQTEWIGIRALIARLGKRCERTEERIAMLERENAELGRRHLERFGLKPEDLR